MVAFFGWLSVGAVRADLIHRWTFDNADIIGPKGAGDQIVAGAKHLTPAGADGGTGIIPGQPGAFGEAFQVTPDTGNASTFSGGKVYLDGVELAALVNTGTAPTDTMNTADSFFVVGATAVAGPSSGIGQGFNGLLDEFRIFDHTLAPAKVQTLAQSRVPAGTLVALSWSASSATTQPVQLPTPPPPRLFYRLVTELP